MRPKYAIICFYNCYNLTIESIKTPDIIILSIDTWKRCKEWIKIELNHNKVPWGDK